ncbi:MAG: hypothetical protein VB023_02700 [Oscillibacter sp.]|nr:hypothetical protein [Oscillibacter sp.]
MNRDQYAGVRSGSDTAPDRRPRFWITGTVLPLTGGAWLYLRRQEETTNET